MARKLQKLGKNFTKYLSFFLLSDDEAQPSSVNSGRGKTIFFSYHSVLRPTTGAVEETGVVTTPSWFWLRPAFLNTEEMYLRVLKKEEKNNKKRCWSVNLKGTICNDYLCLVSLICLNILSGRQLFKTRANLLKISWRTLAVNLLKRHSDAATAKTALYSKTK